MSKVMNLEKLGNFRLKRILLEYDSPFIFTCVNEKNKTMLFIENDYSEEEESWVSIFISDDNLYNLLSQKTSIQETFINLDTHTYYLIKHNLISDVFTYQKLKSFPEGILNSGNDFLPVVYNNEEALLMESLKEVFNENLMPAMDLHFNKFTGKHSLPIEFLINVLTDVKKVYNGIIRVKSNSLEVEPCPGSLVLRFKSIIPDKTIDKNTSAYAFKTIENILLSSDPEDVKSVLLENPRIISPLKSLYSTLAKNNRDFEIATITEDITPVGYKTISSKNVSDFYSNLKNKKISDSKEIKRIGVMEGFDNVRWSFSFRDNFGKLYKGKISPEINEKNPKIKDEFEVILVETTEVDLENAKDKKTHVLKHISHI